MFSLTYTEIDSEYCYIEPNLDCVYAFPLYYNPSLVCFNKNKNRLFCVRQHNCLSLWYSK